MSATLTAGIASLILNIDAPLEADLVTPRDDLIGVKVWVDTSSAAFVPSAGNLVFDGNSLSITIPNLAYGTVHYVKYALISDIEPDNYIVSSALSATPLESTYQRDTTPPPTPTGVVFTAGITNIQVSHDVPSYLQGHGHAKSALYGKEYTGGALPTFAQSVSLAEFTGNSYSFATQPATTWRLWLVWVTNDGVASTVPFGGTNGQAVITAQDPSKLADVLAGQITETELGTALNARISLVDGSVNTPGTVAYQIAQEAALRADQIQIESHTRLISVQEAAEAALDAVLAANNERVDRTADVALARTELNENLVDGLSAEASQRTILAAQLRGGYSGTDLNQVTSGLIYEEKKARAEQDSALALSISLLSAGVGEQFDWKSIWYFDTGVDGWSGNGTPTVTNGFLRPANQASSAYVTSPTGLAIDTAKYQEIRFRIRKVGNPTFAGFIWWNATAQSWDTARRQSITSPSYDVQGIAVITESIPWSATASVDQIRVDLSSAQTATDYFEIDWFAVGRPSPAASTAQILDEAVARAAADSAEVTARQTLSNFLFGANEPGSLTLGTIVDGIIFDEKTARSSADTSMASDITTLQSSVTTLDGEITTLQGDVTTISNTVSTLDAVTASTSTQVRAQSKQLDETAETALRNALAGDSNRVKSTNEVALARQELQANIVEGLSAEANARLTLETKVNQNNANIVENYYTKSSTDSAIAQKATLLRAYSNLSSKTFAQGTAPTNRGTDPDTGSTIALQIGDLWINTSDSNSQSRWDGSSWVAATDESSLDAFITSTYDPAIQNLSDSKIESWFGTTDPSTTWTGTATSHTGDLWYNSTTKLFKRWSGSAWTTIEDKTAIDAAAAASAAQSTADGKITTFAQTTAPTAEGVGDLWIDTNDNNKPYRWNGTSWIEIRDANIAAVDARVDTVETVKIGYCTLAGATTAHANRTTCEAAGGTWNVGLPWATAVKLVSVQDANGNTASISDSFDAIKTVNDGLKASKVVKIDNNGRVSGYGLYSGATTSEFIANVDKFAVASPDSSVSLWAASTAYSVGACRRLASNSAKMLVCKVAGTSAASAPSIAGAIGSLVTDGTVTWQIASRVPFSVVSASTVIDGVTVPPGVYIDGAMIVNETVNNQQIANAAVDNSKIANVNVDKLVAGSLQTNSYIRSSNYVAGTSGFNINYDGNAEFNSVSVRGTLDSVTGTFGALTVNNNGNIKSGQTAYNTGSGFWLGNDAGTSKFSIGNASGNRLTWDGSVLSINGTASATVVSGAASGATAVQPATLTSSLAPKLEAGTSYTLTGVVTPADTGALKVGTITWNSTTGALTGGSGIAITENGIIGANAGVSKFSIDASGNATFAGTLSAATGSFSGEVTATSGSIGGNTITSTLVKSPSYSPGSSGWALKDDGSAEFQNVLVRGDIEVPDGSINASKLSAESITSDKLAVGSASFFESVDLLNTWSTTGSYVTLGEIDFSSATLDGRMIKIYVVPNTITAVPIAEQLLYSRLEISTDGTTWDIAKQFTYTTDEFGTNYVTAPYGDRYFRLGQVTYGGVNQNYYWGSSTVQKMLNSYAVWPSGSSGGTHTMTFTIFLPYQEDYTLTYVADNSVNAGSTLTGAFTTINLPTYNYANAPIVQGVTTNTTNSVATLSVSCTDTSGLQGFAAYITRNSTGEQIWNSRQPNYVSNVYKKVRVRAQRSSNGSIIPNVQGWLAVEILKK